MTMTQTPTKQESKNITNTIINEESKEVYISDILQAIQGINRKHWLNLLQIIQAFQLATNNEQEMLSSEEISTEKEIEKLDTTNSNQAILDLLNLWEEEGDVKEQTETLNYLLEVLD